MSWLTLVITVPFTLFAVLFAVSNSAPVDVSLWPLEEKMNWPLSLVGLCLLAAGFFCGALFVWILSQRVRFRLWQETRRADKLEKELDLLNKKAQEPEAPATPVQPVLPPR